MFGSYLGRSKSIMAKKASGFQAPGFGAKKQLKLINSAPQKKKNALNNSVSIMCKIKKRTNRMFETRNQAIMKSS